METATALLTADEDLLALVDVEDLEDGDLDNRLTEIHPVVEVVAPRVGRQEPASRQAEVDAVLTAWTIGRDRRSAVYAHRLGARAAALLAA
ncbi:hypothetical protein [Blastococcus sp. SYSU D00820]